MIITKYLKIYSHSLIMILLEYIFLINVFLLMINNFLSAFHTIECIQKKRINTFSIKVCILPFWWLKNLKNVIFFVFIHIVLLLLLYYTILSQMISMVTFCCCMYQNKKYRILRFFVSFFHKCCHIMHMVELQWIEIFFFFCNVWFVLSFNKNNLCIFHNICIVGNSHIYNNLSISNNTVLFICLCIPLINLLLPHNHPLNYIYIKLC